jgi:DNA (cytosine-5)-methyltransferase 1
MTKAVDLFCGCGGLSLGFSMAGFEILLGVDNDAAALETFQKNHNSSVINDNIEKITGDDILQEIRYQKIDVILGGPPCQGVSLSGPRKFDDPRNKLFHSFIRILDEIRPKAFVLENVPGLVSLFEGQIMNALMGEFDRMGYDVTTKLLVAADYGVPQLRKRVFFVGLGGHDKKFVLPNPTHFERNPLPRYGKTYISCEDALGDLPPLINELGGEKQEYASPPKNEYQRIMREGSEFVYNHVAINHAEKVKKIISLVPEGRNYKELPEEYKNTRNFHVAWTRFHSKKPAPTVDTGHRHHFHYKHSRVPTVRENARLQSFPDRFIFFGNKTQQYRQVGNAVPPLLAKAVAEGLQKWP